MTEKKKPGKNILPGLTLILLIIAVEVYFPSLVNEQLNKAMSVYFYTTEKLDIGHKTWPAGKLLMGNLNNFFIDGSQLETKRFKVLKLFMEADKLKISMTDLLLNGHFKPIKGTGRIALSISEKELDRYLHRFFIDDPYNEIQFRLLSDGPRVEGVKDGESLYLDCIFIVEKNRVIGLSPRKMVVSGSNKTAMDNLEKVASFALDLGSLGIPFIIDELSIQDDVLYVFGSIE
ncbi:MAG TPA: hypothetical protein GX522_10065 [Firmicutes bacterium]|jgi:hypothetical protein|nr:hypothetical protein [Bacillota bacterium]